MDKVERVFRVIEGRRPDRVPVSFWHHFADDQVCGSAAVAAHVDHVKAFDLDFLKVMNDNGYPHEGPIRTVRELAALGELNGEEPPFARQLDLIADLKRRLGGQMLMTTTVFNAWATLRQLVREKLPGHHPPNLDASQDPPTATLLRFHEEDPPTVKAAIQAVGASLSRFAGRCIEAGADGIFMSVRDDWLDGRDGEGPRYDDLVRDSDRAILSAVASARFNMLHVCGKAVNFRAFAEYPVQVINWADRAAGPAIGEVKDWIKPAICGGVDNLSTLPQGTAEQVAEQVADALRQAAERPIMISAGCTYDPARVPGLNLKAICRAARRP